MKSARGEREGIHVDHSRPGRGRRRVREHELVLELGVQSPQGPQAPGETLRHHHDAGVREPALHTLLVEHAIPLRRKSQ